MIKVALVRGKYLNNFEGQNYRFSSPIQVTGISSRFPLHNHFPFPTIQLPSLADIESRPVKYLSNRTLGDMHILFGLEKYASDFDIFHTADPHYYYSYQLAMLRGQKKISHLISTSWETIAFNNESVGQKKRLKYATMGQVDQFITYTQKAKHTLMLEGVLEEKIKQLYLGVDLNTFHPTQASLSRGKVTVLFVGRNVPEKGAEDFKAVLSQFSRSNIVPLFITGTVEYDKMPEIYRCADIIVVPSKKTKTWEEQYGMVLVEAMASGLPIIAYDTGVIAELVGNVGMVIKPSKKALYSSLEKLTNDTDLRRRLGKAARTRAEKLFNANTTALEIGRIYHDLTKTDRSHSRKK